MTQREQSLEETLREFEKRADFFTHPEWEKMCKELREQLNKDKLAAPNVFTTNDEWQKFRGHCEAIERLLLLPTSVDNLIVEIKEMIEQRDAKEGEDEQEAYI